MPGCSILGYMVKETESLCDHAWLAVGDALTDRVRCVKCGAEADYDDIEPNAGLAEEFNYGV